MIDFQWTVRAGDILTMGGAIVVAGAFLYRRGRDESTLESAVRTALNEISELKAEFKAFSITIARIAVQETKIDLLMRWYDELRRGIGKIDP